MGKGRRNDAPAPADPNVDRYPDLDKVLTRLLSQVRDIEGPVGRLELHTFASGDATYNVWGPRGGEPQGGYLPAQ